MAVDSPYPNLALMKISAWHKMNGDVVEWYTPFEEYDVLYMSKIFSFTPDYGQWITNVKENEVLKLGLEHFVCIVLGFILSETNTNRN